MSKCAKRNKLLHFGFLCCLNLLAGENLGFLTAGVALDGAAPLELAVALPHPCVVVRVVTPAAAHHVAAVRVGRRAVAQSASCPGAPRGRVLLAVIGRALQVHEVRVRGLLVVASLFKTQEGRLSEARGPDRLHLNRFAVALLQHVADLPELRQGDPAGPSRAGAGDAVTLALQLHSLLQDLLRKEEQPKEGENPVPDTRKTLVTCYIPLSLCELTFLQIPQVAADHPISQLHVKNLWKNNSCSANRSL